MHYFGYFIKMYGIRMIKFIKKSITNFIYKILDSLMPFLYESNRRYTQIIYYSLLKKANNIRIGIDNNIEGINYINIGGNCVLGNHLCIEAIDHYQEIKYNPKLNIGEKVFIGDYCHIGCINELSIGNGTLIARRVFITDHFHGNINHNDLLLPPVERPLSSKPVKIGDNVWIGEAACIMPGVTLGNNVIVGANAVVTHSFEDNSVIAGVPAKLIRKIN